MKTFFSIILILIILNSCNKNNNQSSSGSCEQSMAKIAGTYSFLKFETDIVTPGTYMDVTNDVTFVQPCVKDNQLTLNANGTAIYTDLGSQCTPPKNDNAGSWSLPSSGKISVSFPTNALNHANADIVSFDCKTLVLVHTNPASAKSRFTYKK